jgi:hypothetical protein
MNKFRAIGLAGAALAGVGMAGSATALDVTGQATVASLELASSTRVSRTVFEYTYRIRVANVGEDLGGVIATVRSVSPATEVVNGNVDVGDLPAGVVVLSADTFTIRHDRTVPFGPAVLSWTIDAASVVPSALRLNEVRFSPLPADAPFVELWNSGSTPISLGTFRLRNEQGGTVALPNSVTIPPGGFALVLIDGQSGVNGATVHASDVSFLGATGGTLELLGPAGFAVDRVAWGDRAGSVSAAGGGFSDGTPAGASYFRAPGVAAPAPTSWAIAFDGEVSPGLANPVPSVQTLLPFSGAIVSEPQVSLRWYPVAGATSYRVQVTTDPGFAVIVSDQLVSSPEALVPALAAGSYYWRVLAIGANGANSTFSVVNTLSVDPTSSPAAALSTRSRPVSLRLSAGGPSTLAATSGMLNVPVPARLSQHKDSRMLLLESQREHGEHGWSVDHAVLDVNDPADNGNCGLASVAMVNRLFGGQLSQDRIGFHLFRGRYPGPEWDLSSGPVSGHAISSALTFALGGAPSTDLHTSATEAAFWQLIRNEIDAGRPIVMGVTRQGRPGHIVVLVGYSDATGKRLISYIDPWVPGSSSGILKLAELPVLLASTGKILTWSIPTAPQPVSDEPEIAIDSDNDGLVDFDETQRFGTDPFDPDTDGDFVSDFVDVRASVFDRQFGYAHNPWIPREDVDGDGAAMELDADSDGDKCTDGQEDFTLNGDYEPALGESHNFFSGDKRCRSWFGTSRYEFRLRNAPFTRVRAIGRLEWVPRGGSLSVDTVSFDARGELIIQSVEIDNCRFLVNPNTTQDVSGDLLIDYTLDPALATGNAGGTIVGATLTNCQGGTFQDPNLTGAILFDGPVPLNAAQDQIRGTRTISGGSSDITIEMDYNLGPR